MTYTKPEINVLGDAAELIEFVGQKPNDGSADTIPPLGDPAYDLDE